MPNFNKIFLMGNLTRDPELRYTPNGTAVCGFSIAVNMRYTDKSGQTRRETTFVDCTAFAKRAETISEYLKKGSPIFVEGRLKMDSWVGKDGQRQNKFSVVVQGFQFLGRAVQAGTGEVKQAETAQDNENKQDVDDDIPF
ncbi:MAG: single-stranded DNA-binding protein [Armatimonadetes bacterium]|nr:single-stranded DNA-binding protein [Armatimonadota bacterium]